MTPSSHCRVTAAPLTVCVMVMQCDIWNDWHGMEEVVREERAKDAAAAASRPNTAAKL